MQDSFPQEILTCTGRVLTAERQLIGEGSFVHVLSAERGRFVPKRDRRRMRAVFGFDFAVECYLPAAKRRYGYFCLPILHRGELVGRLDPKAHRKDGLFEVKAMYLEPGVAVSDELVAGLAATLADCARWHGTPEVIVRRSDPPELAGPLQEALVSA